MVPLRGFFGFGVAVLSFLAAAGPAASQTAAAREDCVPGSGPALGSAELRERLAGDDPLSVPRGAAVVGPLDRRLFCPDTPEEVPCFLAGPVQLSCARIVAPLEWRKVVINGDLLLEGASIEAGIRLEDVQVLGSLILQGARLTGDLVLDHVLVNGPLNLEQAVLTGRFAGKDLRVLGDLTLLGAVVPRGIDLQGSMISGNLDFSPRQAQSIALSAWSIQGDASLHSLETEGDLVLDGLFVRGAVDTLDLNIGGAVTWNQVVTQESITLAGAFRKAVTLTSCQTGGDLQVLDSNFNGPFTLNNCSIGGEAVLTETHFQKTLRVENSGFTGGLDLGTSTVNEELALIGSRFGGLVEITSARLGSAPRVAACTPANPLSPTDEETGFEPSEETVEPD